MSLLGGLHTLLNRAGNTIHNDIVKPIQRDIAQPVAQATQPINNGLVHLWQLTNQNSGANQGSALQNKAAQAFHYTPAFNQLISSAHPSLNSQSFSHNGNLAQHVQAMGESFGTQQTNPSLVNEIQLAKGMGTPQDYQIALTHEGLHQQWAQASNQQKDQFLQAYNKAVTSSDPSVQGLKQFLTARLNGYSQAPKLKSQLPLTNGISQSYNNIGNLSPEIQNEVHSFIPEYYSHFTDVNNPLTQYYSQFFNPTGTEPLRPGIGGAIGGSLNPVPRAAVQPSFLSRLTSGGAY